MPLSTDEVDTESLNNFGTATAPASGAALVTLTTPAAGMYKVRVECCHAAGTPGAGEDGNFVLRRAAVAIKRMATTRIAGQQYSCETNIRVDGTQNLSVNTNGAGTASVVYVASITATRIGD